MMHAETDHDIMQGLNDQQKEAVQRDMTHCTKIVAGAGTGKTEIIARRFIKICRDILQQGCQDPASKILVITFTEKAAANMKDRIRSYLNQYLGTHTHHHLWISTFHGLCHKLLKKHSIEVGLVPDFTIATFVEQKTKFESLIEKIITHQAQNIDYCTDVLADLGVPQDIFSTDTLTSLTPMGDPETLLYSSFHIIEKIKSSGLSPKEFIQKARQATEQFTRCVETIPFGLPDEESYYDTWGKHLTPYVDDLTSLTREIFDDIAATKLIINKNNARGKEKVKSWGHGDGFPETMPSLLSCELKLIHVIGAIYALYQDALIQSGTIDFNDLINLTMTILHHRPDIRQHYQEYFDHIIVDEFQDTNANQLELIKLLLKETYPNITFVGDRKQSIYAFRHAQVENLDILHTYIEHFFKQPYQAIQLERNYRSTDAVIESVNRLTTDTMNLQEMLSAKSQHPHREHHRHVKTVVLTGGKNLEEYYTYEAQFIAQEILRMKQEDLNLSFNDIAILVRSNTRALIVENALKRYGIPAIKQQNNHFFNEPEITNILAFYRFIKNTNDEMALLKLLEIYFPDWIVYKIVKKIDTHLQTQQIEISTVTLAGKLKYLHQENLWYILTEIGQVKEIIQSFFILAEAIHNSKKQVSLLDIFFKIVNQFVLRRDIQDQDKAKIHFHLKIFEKILVDYADYHRYQNIKKFLEDVEAWKQDKNYQLPQISTDEIDAVQIPTIHASKGLEYAAVFVTGYRPQSFPSDSLLIFDMQYGAKTGFGLVSKKFFGKESPKYLLYKKLWHDPRSQQEDQRLFYVAISRAKKYLTILGYEHTDHYTLNVTRNIHTIDISSLSSCIDTSKSGISPSGVELISLPQSMMMPPDIKIEKSLKLSYSKISTFKTCPLHYWLKYHAHLHEEYEKSESSEIGQLFHQLLSVSYLEQKVLNREELQHFLKIKCGSPLLYDMTLHNLYNQWAESCFSPHALTQNRCQPEQYFYSVENFPFGTVVFDGYIDLVIYSTDNTVSIVDFKTIKEKVAVNTDYFLQLCLYKKALESQGYKVNKASIVYISETNWQIQPYPVEQDLVMVQELHNYVTAIHDLHRISSLSSFSCGLKCTNCSYSPLVKSFIPSL